MADIFDEVEEEVRQEQYLNWLRRYGLYMVAAIAAVLAVIGGWRLYQGWQVDRAREASSVLITTARQAETNPAQAGAALEELSRSAPSTYRVFANGERAQLAIGRGDFAAAIARLDEAAAATSDPLLRDTARLRAAFLVAETQDFTALDARLQPIIAAGGPLSYVARELRGIEAWEAGRLGVARETLEGLTLALQAPQAVRQRARIAMQIIGPAPEAPRPTASGAARPAAPATSPAGASQ